MVEILTAGEALVDWVSTEAGADLEAARHWVKAPGGAPLNVAVGLARLGARVGFAGCLADDAFGAWLRAIMDAEGVDTGLAEVAEGRQTRMAYITTTAGGDRHLAAFSTVAPADAALSDAQMPQAVLDGLKAFCFGSLILGGAPSGEAVLKAARRVAAGPGLSVFDPNIRPVLWPDQARLRALLDQAMDAADLLKVGDDELAFLTGEHDPARGAAHLLDRHGLAAVVVTRGAAGAYFRTRAASGEVPSYPVTAVDATGAGDGFVAGLLAGLAGLAAEGGLAARVRWLDEAAWRRLLAEANAVGAIATTRAGAISSLPTRAALEAFLASP